MRPNALISLAVLLVFVSFAPLHAAPDQSRVCRKDVESALKAMKSKCGHFFKQKDINWKAVGKEMLTACKEVKTPEDQFAVLLRLTARLKDGHAAVYPKDKSLKYPFAAEKPQSGPGMFWCRSGKKIFVKNVWSAAGDTGITAGMQVTAVEGQPVEKWLAARIAALSDHISFSTDQQAFFFACHWGLSGDQGGKFAVELRTLDGKRKKANIFRRRASTVPSGPVFPPADLKSTGRQSYGKTAAGYGYIHLRDTPGEIPSQMDQMLKEIGPVPGMILDCRANGGGGFDHEAVFGRFVPKGKRFYVKSAGETPYGGPMVVIVDAGTRSAGETASGMFKEDGRAWMIGESPTAGMSSSKEMIELPSGQFSIKVSVYSNKKRFNGGKGIEGIGVIPNEIVPYDPRDLHKGIDTQIKRAEELLADFPAKKVPYKPAKFGWKAP